MGIHLTTVSDGKKFMWDGQVYASKEEALRAKASYEAENFEVHLSEQEGNFVAYTRRMVKEVIAHA